MKFSLTDACREGACVMRLGNEAFATDEESVAFAAATSVGLAGSATELEGLIARHALTVPARKIR